MNPRIHTAEYYRVLAEIERSDPWARAMREMGLALLEGRVGKGGAILDVGCGAGLFLAEAERLLRPALALGGDLSPYASADVRFSALQAPFAEGRFDLVILNDVLQHCPDALAECARLLRPGGVLLLRTAARRGWLWKRHRDSEDYRQFSAASLRAQIEAQGLKVERLTAANWLPSVVADLRAFFASRSEGDVGLRPAGSPVGLKARLLARYWKWEAGRLRLGSSLPGGHSLVALASRPPLPSAGREPGGAPYA